MMTVNPSNPPSNAPRRALHALRTSLSSTLHHLHLTNHHNLHTLTSSPLRELSGSLGDLGTLLPLLIALTLTNSISLPATLLFSGLSNIASGLFFGLPLPVQPMKAIAAVAIAESFSPEDTASAGLFVAGAIGVFSVTGTLSFVATRVPVPVVKGIQVGAALTLAQTAGKLYIPSAGNNVLLPLLFLILLLSPMFPRLPLALLFLVAGVVTAAVQESKLFYPWRGHYPSFPTIYRPELRVPSIQSFERGLLEAGVGQLPLTALNSVIAVSFLAQDLLPDVPTPSTTALGLSVAGMNLVGCWFGAMPMCHGSGGLAAQYRFGARSGASVIMLGVVKVFLGVFGGDVAEWVFRGFPRVVLAVMVIAASLELAKVGESLNVVGGASDLRGDGKGKGSTRGEGNGVGGEGEGVGTTLGEEERQGRWMVMFATVVGMLAFRNVAVGFAAGMACHWCLRGMAWWEARRERGRRGRIRLEGA